MNVTPNEPTSAELAKRTLQRRAVEATIWGMPAVSMAAIRASLKRDLDANPGDVVYFSNVMEPRHEFLTANNQTPYVFTCFDLRQGPMVLEVPAASDKVAFFGSGIDSWEVPLVDVGPTGDDAGKGGRYLFLPPAYEGPSSSLKNNLIVSTRKPVPMHRESTSFVVGKPKAPPARTAVTTARIGDRPRPGRHHRPNGRPRDDSAQPWDTSGLVRPHESAINRTMSLRDERSESRRD